MMIFLHGTIVCTRKIRSCASLHGWTFLCTPPLASQALDLASRVLILFRPSIPFRYWLIPVEKRKYWSYRSIDVGSYDVASLVGGTNSIPVGVFCADSLRWYQWMICCSDIFFYCHGMENSLPVLNVVKSEEGYFYSQFTWVLVLCDRTFEQLTCQPRYASIAAQGLLVFN